MTPPILNRAVLATLQHLAAGGELLRDADGWHYRPEGEARVFVTQRDAATLSGWQLIAREWSAEETVRYHITDRGREALK